MQEVKRQPGVALRDAGYLLNRVEVERMGRWNSFRRTASGVVFLGVLAVPLSLVSVGWLDNRTPELSLSVISRIALVIETVLLGAVVLCAWRTVELVKSSRAPQRIRTMSRVVFGVLVVMAAVDVAENVYLWTVREGLPADWTVGFNIAMVAGCSVGLLLGAGIAMVSSPGFWWRREGNDPAVRRFPIPRRILNTPTQRLVETATGLQGEALDTATAKWRSVLEDPEKVLARPPDPAGTIICCSGGGIRSASFCLGGLQTLTARRVYGRARAVVGVSGGGYIAAAYHVLRWRSGDTWTRLDPPAFDARTPEMRWLRRHSRYLVESPRVATLGFLALLYGMAVNFMWLLLVMAATAGWLALFFQVSGGLHGVSTPDAVGADYTGGWSWVDGVWGVAALGGLIYVGERVVERFVTIRHAARERTRSLAVYLIWVGLALTALLVALPLAMAAVHNWVVRSDGTLAGLLYQLGAVPVDACNARLPAADACGVAATSAVVEKDPPSALALPASLATVTAAVIAVVQAAKASLSPDSKTGGKALTRTLTKGWRLVRDTVVPWTAAVVVGLVVVGVVWRWIASLVRDPAPLGDWTALLVFVGVLAVLRLVTEANRTSLHHFYRERLSYAYLMTRMGRRVMPLEYREALRFSASTPPPGGGPELVSCAVANVSDTAYVPTDRRCTPFVFDARSMGLTDDSLPSGPCLTSSVIYERAADPRARDATLVAALAISGAAFSPLVGRQNVRVGPYRAILALGNARLGVWLPNPIWVDDVAETRTLIRRRNSEAVQAYAQLRANDQVTLMDSLKPRDHAWFESMRWQRYRSLPSVDRDRHDLGLAPDHQAAWLTTVTRHDRAAYRRLDRPGRDDFRESLTSDELLRLDVLMASDIRDEYGAKSPHARIGYLLGLSNAELDRLRTGRPALRRAPLDADRIARLEQLGEVDRGAYLDLRSSQRSALLQVQELAERGDDDPGLPSERVDPRVWLTLAWREVFGKPGPFRLAKEAFGQTSVLDRRLYVTDGGHYDNLGLVEALRRRPAEVFVLDASSDPEDSFRALGDAIATARIDLGVELRLELTELMRGEEKIAKAGWTSGKAVYADGEEADVHFVKVVMVGKLPWDAETYKRFNPEFPLTSTGRQLYGEFDLEAYRILGRELTARLLDQLGVPPEDAEDSGGRGDADRDAPRLIRQRQGGQSFSADAQEIQTTE